MKKIVDIIKEEISLLEMGAKSEQERTRVRRLPPNASINDKIKMWELINKKAWKLYRTRKYSEMWIYAIYEKYGKYWDELYDEIRGTPEFIQHSKQNNYTLNRLTFGDMLA